MVESSLSYLDEDVIREINVLVYTISLIKSSMFIVVIREWKEFYEYGYVGSPTPYKSDYYKCSV